MPPIFLDARSLAERLDISYASVQTWARRGVIPSVRDGRGRRMFNLNRVLDALTENAATYLHQSQQKEPHAPGQGHAA